MRQENETLPLYRRCPSPQSRANHFKENPLFPLQKGQLGKKEGSDNWKQLPPRAAPACPKGGAAQASVPHSPTSSQMPISKEASGSSCSHPHPSAPGASSAPSPLHKWSLMVCGHSHQLFTGQWNSVTIFFNSTSLGFFRG